MTNPKPYTSLANKYRPQTFEEVVGQKSVASTLTNAVKSGRISHAYLFYGPRGCGKTTTARILAKALNCTGNGNTAPTAKPCGKCPQCLEIAASSDLDVLELDAASNTQVERVREAIIDTVALAAGRDRYKVFILDEVHMLSTSSFNALLKTIEEPPSHVVFILATTELHKVPLTITSRCQTFRFKPITEEDISSHLIDLAGAENIELDEDCARLIAKNAGGALRDALTILDRAISFSDGKITKELLLQMLGILPQDLVKKAVEALTKKDGKTLHEVFVSLKEEGYDALSLLKDLKNALGAIFYLSYDAAEPPFEGAKTLLEETSAAYIAGLTRKISKLADEVKYSDTPMLAAEVGLFSAMESSLDIENLVARLEALEASLDSAEDKEESPAPTQKATPSKQSAAKAEKKSSSDNIDLETKKTTALPVKTCRAEIAPQRPAREENPQTCQKIWSVMKKEMDENFPFLYEAVNKARVNFQSSDRWQIIFGNDDFYFSMLERRQKDFEELAEKCGGCKIKFEILKSDENLPPAQEEQDTPFISAQSSLPEDNLSGPALQSEVIISSQEPFVEGDFSSYVNAKAMPAARKEAEQKIIKAAEEITEKKPQPALRSREQKDSDETVASGEFSKKILNIFEGEVVKSI